MPRLIAGLIFLVVVALAGHAGHAAPARALPLRGELRGALTELAQPIADCVVRRDTDSPAFHGCYDWHSAVHANLTLRAVSRLTGQPAYRATADEVATVSAVADEHAHLGDGRLIGELPYGYSWLLLLDVEARRPDVHAMAADAAADVRGWLNSNIDRRQPALNTRYGSSAWAAFALHRWYRAFAPERADRFAAEMAPRLLAHRAAACSTGDLPRGFLDPCAALLMALSQLSRDATVDRAALAEMAAVVAGRRALRSAQLTTIFQAGLNFSRAWSLYLAAEATGDRALVAAGDRLFHAHLDQPALWRQGYAQYSHWVAQFGVFALMLRSEIEVSGEPVPSPSGPTPPPTPPGATPIPSLSLPPAPPPGPTDEPWLGERRVAPSVWAR